MWGEQIRERIASQVPHIRHWRVEDGPYWQADDLRATWYIDPPYQKVERDYRCGSRAIDFAHLAEWCQERRGQIIVCEQEGADWLPFQPLARIKGTARDSAEVAYLADDGTAGGQMDLFSLDGETTA